jgi:glycosyltransferase involved in cell wall biosynthesis
MSSGTVHGKACRLVDLPPPPDGKTGWPWTEESPALPERMPDGSEWPLLSIVTPSYNQGKYLEETLRSVLLQGYPNLEYIVIDGGSQDGARDVIRKYEPFLTQVLHERSEGHADALNKGMKRATGAILAFINSDDYYLPGAFAAVAREFQGGKPADLIYGGCLMVDPDGREFIRHFGDVSNLDEILDFKNVWRNNREIVQPEAFWRRSIYEKTGAISTAIHGSYLYEYWCRMLMAGAVFRRIDEPLACFRFQPEQRSQLEKDDSYEEYLTMAEPWLWDRSLPISPARRNALQGDWAFQRQYIPAMAASAKTGESSLKRWLGTAALCLRYPALFPVLPQVYRLRVKFFGAKPIKEDRL